jgi:hypothetical protein
MGQLVSLVADRPIAFDLPFREQTKAEMVRALADDGLGELALQTVSCAHFPLRTPSPAKQCGTCPACLHRRQALLSARIAEPSDVYKHDLFGDATAANAVPAGKLTHLKATLMQVNDPRELRRSSPLPDNVRRHLLGAEVVEPGESLDPWLRVLERYRDEWLCLIADAQSRSRAWGSLFPTLSWPNLRGRATCQPLPTLILP